MTTHDEVYLTKQEFMLEFVMDDDGDVYRACKKGMPRKMICGVWMYPRYACHRWFAGETE